MYHLNVTGICGVAVTVGVLGSTRAISNGSGSVVLLATPRAEPVLLVLGLGVHLDFTGSGVAGEGIISCGVGGLVAAPPAAAATRGIAICGRGTEALLALVVTGKKNLEEDGN